jgi:hypothetical protein
MEHRVSMRRLWYKWPRQNKKHRLQKTTILIRQRIFMKFVHFLLGDQSDYFSIIRVFALILKSLWYKKLNKTQRFVVNHNLCLLFNNSVNLDQHCYRIIQKFLSFFFSTGDRRNFSLIRMKNIIGEQRNFHLLKGNKRGSKEFCFKKNTLRWSYINCMLYTIIFDCKLTTENLEATPSSFFRLATRGLFRN